MSKQTSTHPKWNREQFIAFLLLYAANIDAEYSPEERDYIQSIIEPQALDIVDREFQSMSDFEHIQVIRAYEGSFYPSPEHKEAILNRVQELFRADGTFSQEESNLLMMLKKIL